MICFVVRTRTKALCLSACWLGRNPCLKSRSLCGYQFKPCKYNQFLPKGVLPWHPNFDEKRHCDIFLAMSWNIGGKSITLQSSWKRDAFSVEVYKNCPNGGIGRRVGLKIQCPLKTCRFEPGFGHKNLKAKVFNIKTLAF